MYLLTWKLDAILGGGTLTFSADTSLLKGKQKVSPIAVWYKSASQLEAWTVFCTGFLGDDGVHPATYKMLLLLKGASGVIPRLRKQAPHQTTFPAALICLIQQEFNKIFRQALERRHQVRWSNFESLQRDLVTGNFRPKLVALPEGIVPQKRPQPPPVAPRHQALATPTPAVVTTPTP